jgi:hypothetical protein
MKKTALAAVALVLLALPPSVRAQAYTMYEVQRVSALPGSTVDIGTAMVEHNQKFHAEAPYSASVYYLVTGQYSGQYQWIMGPTKFTQMDARPADASHGSDWANRVLAHAEVHETEYWRQIDDLSYAPENMPEGIRPVSLVRRFNVTDNALFIKLQGQIMEVFKAAGSPNPRTMYQRQFLSADPWGWAMVMTYPNLAALDEPGFDFEAQFRALHGDAGWDTFNKEFNQAVAGRDDAIRQLITGM